MKRTPLISCPRRLRAVANASLCIGAAEVLATLLGVRMPIVLGLTVLATCLIGIAAIARAWWIESKQ